jgi:glucokinase
MLLAGDIGATKTVLATFSHESGVPVPVAEAIFPSDAYPSLDAVIADFPAAWHPRVTQAAFGVAGPVLDGRAHITNLGWDIDAASLSRTLSLPAVTLLNDLEATATAVPHLEPADVYALTTGEPRTGGAIAVIAPGTGLGEAFLTWNGTRYQAHATEGGHVDFAPRNDLEIDLLQYLLAHSDHISYEDVCSGLAVPHLYRFLRDSGRYDEPPWLAARLRAADDPTPVIIDTALDQTRPSPIGVATLDLFVSILAAEAGNLALKVLATGGVYLAGGIPPRILDVLGGNTFRAAFTSKGRMSALVSRMPVRVITNPKAALLGAAYAAMEPVT